MAAARTTRPKARVFFFKFFNYIQTKYLAGESVVRSVSRGQPKVFARDLGRSVTADARADRAEKICNAFANGPKTASGPAHGQVANLAEAMRILGSPKAGIVALA